MKKMSFTTGLMMFNERVLDQGTPKPDVIYEMDDLKRMMFFNRIFISNTDEIFQRYKTNRVINAYLTLIQKFVANMNQIQILSSGMIDWNCDVKRYFIRRVKNCEMKLVRIPNEEYKGFINGYYFIFKTYAGEIFIADINDSDLIKTPFSSGRSICPMSKVVRTYISEYYKSDCVLIKTSVDDNGVVKKVEYDGSFRTLREVAKIFGRYALIVENPFTYNDDMDQMLKLVTRDDLNETQTLENVDIMSLLNQDKWIEYPNDSFNSYLSFLNSAVNNSETESMYITFYRIGEDPTLFDIMKRATERGIDVHINVEVEARGEEKINREWVEKFESIGVHVTTYGKGFIKIHSKLTLIKFHNGKALAQIGTGNFHTKTTSQYTDLCLITADDSICDQVERVFKLFKRNHLKETEFNNDLLVTLFNTRERLNQLIDEEGSKGTDGYIVIKCNALADNEIIEHLDEAASNGCHIDLIIRGACTWIPDYDNVTVRSIVWDKLEHSRIFAFGRFNPTVYLGSLDLVPHKLDRRIETMVRIKNPDILIEACNYLNRYITTTTGLWIMQPNGRYRKE